MSIELKCQAQARHFLALWPGGLYESWCGEPALQGFMLCC